MKSAMFAVALALLWGIIPGAAQKTQASACKAPKNKGLKAPIATGALLVGSTVAAERINGGWSQAGSVASDVVYTGGYIITNRDYERSRRYEACLSAEAERARIASLERVENARIKVWDRRNARRAQVELGRDSARTGRDIKTSEKTDDKGNISLSSSAPITNPAGRRGGGSNAGPLVP